MPPVERARGNAGRSSSPGFGPAEVTWDDGTVSSYPGADLKVMGKIQPVTAEPWGSDGATPAGKR